MGVGRTEFNSNTKLPGQGPLVLAGEFWRRVVVVDGRVVVAEDVVACGVFRVLRSIMVKILEKRGMYIAYAALPKHSVFR